MTIFEFPMFDGNALCAEVDPDAWFPEKGGKVRAVEKLCSQCEIRLPCLEWSLDNHEKWGTWGGLSENQRRRLLRSSGRAA